MDESKEMRIAEDMQDILINVLDSKDFDWTGEIETMPRSHEQLKDNLSTVTNTVQFLDIASVLEGDGNNATSIYLTLIKAILARYGCLLAKYGQFLESYDIKLDEEVS